MAKNENLEPLEKQSDTVPGYTPEGEEKKVHDQYLSRKGELFNSRRNVYGYDINQLMRRLDAQYFNRVANIPASELDPDQRPVAINNAFGKIQTAIGLLLDRNPEITLDESDPKYTSNRELLRGLAKSSWKNTNSLGQLKLSIFNCAKRGWFVGRTYHKYLKHDARFLTRIDDDPSAPEYTPTDDPNVLEPKTKPVYETKQITKMDDVAYMNINNFNAWIDEQSTPEDFFSTRDWMWREVWHIDDVKRIFPKEEFPNMEFVKEGGDTRETIEGVTNANTGSQSSSNEAKSTKKGMTELFFYENQYDDWFIVEINGVMVVWEPLPQDSKRLSLVYGYWNLRGAESIYGIGVIEEMERNEELIDRIMNMSMRQLLLTISPPGFYTGTEDPDDANLKYNAGVLKRTLDPKSITFLEIPEGNENAMKTIEWLEGKQDQMTGITNTLEGDRTQEGQNPTAFELGVNREAGLKRLRLPLKSIQYALEWEFNNRISLIKQVYSDFTVEHIADPEDINAFLDDVKADPDFFFIENEGQPGKEKFFKKSFRTTQLNVDQDDKGNFVESETKKFFRIKPEYLVFEGDVSVDTDSMLIQSEELEKADTLRMANILVPLLASDPKVVGRPVKQLLLAFNKDPRKWLPDTFLDALNQMQNISPYKKPGAVPRELTPPAGAEGQPDLSQAGQGAPKADTVVPAADVSGNVGLGNRMSAAFNAFKNPGQ